MDSALNLIKSITEEELGYISMADYGQDVKKHKEALRTLLFEQNGIVNNDQYWFPYEVVELSRWSCKEGHEREFSIANAIIALSILANTECTNSIEIMFDQLSNQYENLPLALKNVVMELLFLANEHQEQH